MNGLLEQKLYSHLNFLYPDHDTEQLAGRIIKAFWPGSGRPKKEPSKPSYDFWSECDSMVITYGDSILDPKKKAHPLMILDEFLNKYLEGTINWVHVLPFFPYSSDDGFAVKDYMVVREDLGDWNDIAKLGKDFSVMADLVINHVSAQSEWFTHFKTGKKPETDYFVTASLSDDLSGVVRPRPSDLLCPVETVDGIKHVWCTFGHDQVDLNFKNPDVLIEMIKIMRHYINNNVRVFRLDAVGFLWKIIGTSCINLPQTHEIIRLLRTLVDFDKRDIVLITETNLPNNENLSYFGNKNEAHVIYNFSFPPLITHALLSGQARYLRRWMMTMPPAQIGTTYLNFTASHDGIGLRPAEGLLPEEEINKMIGTIQGFGGEVSMRKGRDGQLKPYEINVSLFDAMKGTFTGKDRSQERRFLASQTIMMALEGIPAFYIHSLFATHNDYEKFDETGQKRSINRHQWDSDELKGYLKAEDNVHYRVFEEIKRLLKIRVKQPAFHPNATQFTLHLGAGLFGFWRESVDRQQSIFCITNLTKKTKKLPLYEINVYGGQCWVDLISGHEYCNNEDIVDLKPYQSVWITNTISSVGDD